jgi:hypothetical protein
LIDVLVERAERGTEFVWCLGLVGGEERGEDAVVDLGVEECEAQSVVGEVVGVGVGRRMMRRPLRRSRARAATQHVTP